MSVKQIISCDECGIARSDSNHWFLVSLAGDYDENLLIERWDDKVASYFAVRHLCGRECVGKALEKWFSSQGEKA